MISLTRPAIPAGHAARAVRGTKKLWDEWNAKGITPAAQSSIYAHPDVKRALRVEAQHNKCAYCETLNPTSHDVVEHYRPKNGWRQRRGEPLSKPAYFWLSYEWENLLFACDQCNDAAHKENLFPLSNPAQRADVTNPDHGTEKPLLVNPYDVDPELHIEWNRDVPRPRKKSRKGSMSIEVFGLDKDGLLRDQRLDYFSKIELLIEAAENFPTNDPKRHGFVKILTDCLRDAAPWAGMIRSNFSQRIEAL